VAALLWLHWVPRVLTTLYILYDAVWVVVYGFAAHLLLLPFIVLVGLQTAVGRLDIIDTSNLPAAAVFSWLVIMSGIFSAVSALS
jgi:hypothetical protein